MFRNLRASCETDLMANHLIHVMTWIGNTPKIALGTISKPSTRISQGLCSSGAKHGAVTNRRQPTGSDKFDTSL
ncbi:unnamed protein product [Gemmata massiliana]|uniref:Uncharacterized protein n=1 Tax=Gemmata massiliana TaxID=1210884 RepID=A0A6P2D7P9_9BACT|nr:unnamed protein product [Gemmata massiliana]